VDLAHYAVGLVLLAIATVPVAFGARAIRTRVLPDWNGVPAILVDATVFVAIIVGVCEVLGTFGLFRTWAVMSACALAGGVLTVTLPRTAPSAPAPPWERTHEPDRVLVYVTAALVAAVAAWWLLHTGDARRGIVDYDSLNYHMPFATRFVQTGRTLPLHYTTPGYETPFDPENSELFAAFFMLPFHRDFLVPLLNLGWMALALAAAWCIGLRHRVQYLTLAAATVIVGTPLMIHQNAGSASNDIVMIALFLVAVALLLLADDRTEVIVMAGLAAGLGLGTKLSLAIPIAALTIGLPFAARAGHRVRTLVAWLVPLVIAGGYWNARNLFKLGNPIPTLQLGIGSWHLPSPALTVIEHQGYTVGDYLFDGDAWRGTFLPSLVDVFGTWWPLVIGVAIAGMVVALFVRDRLVRVLGVVAAVSFVGYIWTPTTAGGQRDQPGLFAANLRFAFPALILGLVLFAFFGANASRTTRRFILAVFVIALGSQRGWTGGFGLAALAVLAAVCAFMPVPRVRPRRMVGIVAAVTAGSVLVVGGYFLQRQYFDRRYVDAIGHQSLIDRDRLNSLYAWANNVQGARIGVVQLGRQYPLSGADLSNRVQYVGRDTPHGGFEDITNCGDWRRAVNAGRYDYLVIATEGILNPEPVQASWTRGPNARQVFDKNNGVAFALDGPLDPAQCPG
jgi:hypothetical protein